MFSTPLHKNNVSVGNGTKINSGINGLNKYVQKLLWKNIMKSPKANLVLKSLGIMESRKRRKLKILMVLIRMVEVKEATSWLAPDESEISCDGNGCSAEDANGLIIPEKDIENSCLLETEPEAIAESLETDGSSQLQPRSSFRIGTAETSFIRGFVWCSICGAYPDTVSLTVELIDLECTVDFININMGYFNGEKKCIDSLIADIGNWGASAVTIHGRSYWNKHKPDCPELSSCLIARSALIKVSLKLQLVDFNILRGETTRPFLLGWLSYTCRYVPVGLLDVVPDAFDQSENG
ncbi:hypothetical protein DKX38_006348 [Salix brachista]|uniref:Uncharacterized protein n=1 Tax=Salix brachista TaxID=2182728 RepID=A0A5N5N4K1_9ROSI|nr:hypothetical protein DKX38_006348 [Salix brachista]